MSTKRTKLPKHSGAAITKRHESDLKGKTLEELRFMREVAKYDGAMSLAFAIATEIDKRRGFY